MFCFERSQVLNMQKRVLSPLWKQSSESWLFWPCIFIIFYLCRCRRHLFTTQTHDTALNGGALTLSHSPSRHLKWSRTLSRRIWPFAVPPLSSFSPPNQSALHPLPTWRDNFHPHLKEGKRKRERKKVPVACLNFVLTVIFSKSRNQNSLQPALKKSSAGLISVSSFIEGQQYVTTLWQQLPCTFSPTPRIGVLPVRCVRACLFILLTNFWPHVDCALISRSNREGEQEKQACISLI